MTIDFSEEQTELLDRLIPFMLDYNRKTNLTRITDKKDIWIKHFTDSLLPLALHCVPPGSGVIDVGTGAGFPGVPWKIYRPDLKITLLDCLLKRITYLEKLRTFLNLEYRTVHGRSEEISHNEAFRDSFDIAVSRAVAPLPVLAEYCLPFVKKGGSFLAMKGAMNETEIAEKAVKTLGGEIEKVIEYKLENEDKRSLVIVKKISQTPPKYPRKSVSITKTPL